MIIISLLESNTKTFLGWPIAKLVMCCVASYRFNVAEHSIPYIETMSQIDIPTIPISDRNFIWIFVFIKFWKIQILIRFELNARLDTSGNGVSSKELIWFACKT